MNSLLFRAFARVLVWLGLNDPADNRLHASHGWLLPPLSPRPKTVPVTKPEPATENERNRSSMPAENEHVADAATRKRHAAMMKHFLGS